MKTIKPSELIRLAIGDLELVEQMPKTYVVDMGRWHSVEHDKCFVCLAGSFMAMTLHTNSNQTLLASLIDKENQKYLYALNEFRKGELYSGLVYLNIPREKTKNLPYNLPVTEYASDKDQFKKDMLRMADLLESNEL